MNAEKQLRAMKEKLFDDDLLETILAHDRRERENEGTGEEERECREGLAHLAAVLTEEQRAMLSELERLFAENAKYVLSAGFSRGLFAAFQQFFSDAPAEAPFHTLAQDPLLCMPGMAQEFAYYDRNTKINELDGCLEAQLDPPGQEALLSVYIGWHERIYGTLRHAFYLGYRYALSILDRLEPGRTMEQMLPHVLLTEHELGLTLTQRERERFPRLQRQEL